MRYLNCSGDVTTEYWLGGSNANGSWSWTDGTTFDFSEWKKGEPKNDTEVRCTVLSVNNGLWTAQNCSKAKQFICSTPEYIPTVIPTTPTTPSPYKCPDGANFFDLTGYCYLDFFPAEAEKDCFSIGGNYASIHSAAENDFIGCKVFEGLEFVLTSDPPSIHFLRLAFYKPEPPYWVILNLFIGLKRTNYTSAWEWSDGTPVDFTHFGTVVGDPNDEGNCVILNSSMNEWYPVDCGKKYTAICKVRATPV
uniref:C-type lectin domain-containing protein n=1 Tax=Panagrolaimus davidi TaxID=227884 RepID=A0A914PD60_9BILA